MIHRKLACMSPALVMIAALLLSPVLPTALAAPRSAPDAPDVPIVVDNTTSGTIYYNNGCGTFFVDRYFVVTSHFSVSDVKVGLNVSHITPRRSHGEADVAQGHRR